MKILSGIYQLANGEVRVTRLIVFDVYENNAYEIEQELKRSYPELEVIVLIGLVRNSRRVEWVLERYKPSIMYHAAAHKHVLLMEERPNEAVKNNVLGTYETAKAAIRNQVERFAINPTNIMRASKRLCEMILQCVTSRAKRSLWR